HEPGEFGPVLGRELEGPGAGAQDDLAVVLLGALLPTVEGLPRDAVAPGDFGDRISCSQFCQGSLPMSGLLGPITKVVVGIGLFGSHPQASRTRARTVSSYDGMVSNRHNTDGLVPRSCRRRSRVCFAEASVSAATSPSVASTNGFRDFDSLLRATGRNHPAPAQEYYWRGFIWWHRCSRDCTIPRSSSNNPNRKRTISRSVTASN